MFIGQESQDTVVAPKKKKKPIKRYVNIYFLSVLNFNIYLLYDTGCLY